MRDLVRDFGTVLYMHRGFQKRASDAKDAVRYLEKVGVFDPSAAAGPRMTRDMYTDDGVTPPNVLLATGGGALLGGAALHGLTRAGQYGVARWMKNDKSIANAINDAKKLKGSGIDKYRAIKNSLSPESASRFSRGVKAIGGMQLAKMPLMAGGALAGGALLHRLAKKRYDERAGGQA